MKKNILFILVITLLLLPYAVKADVCDANELKKLKEESKVITYQYDYYGGKEKGTDSQTYEIYFENLSSDFFIIIDDNGKRILFDKSGEKEKVQSGKKIFSVNSRKCDSTVNYINIDLPKFNDFSYSLFCEEHEDLEVCGEWYQEELSDDDLEKIIKKYDNDDTTIVDSFINIIKSYYYIFIPGVVILLVIILLLIKNKIKSNRLE